MDLTFSIQIWRTVERMEKTRAIEQSWNFIPVYRNRKWHKVLGPVMLQVNEQEKYVGIINIENCSAFCKNYQHCNHCKDM